MHKQPLHGDRVPHAPPHPTAAPFAMQRRSRPLRAFANAPIGTRPRMRATAHVVLFFRLKQGIPEGVGALQNRLAGRRAGFGADPVGPAGAVGIGRRTKLGPYNIQAGRRSFPTLGRSA